MEKLNKTIKSICDWIYDNLDNVNTMDETQTMPNMILALADLVSANRKSREVQCYSARINI